MKYFDTVVIGAGLSGLAFASFYPEKSGLVVFEQRSVPGGCSQSICESGFTFDFTGHWLHIKNSSLKKWLYALDISWLEITRNAQIFFNDSYLPYPFQAHLGFLDTKTSKECLDGFLNRDHLEENNFKNVLINRFGRGIYNHFMEPYNRKVWGMDPAGMSGEYARKYIPVPSEDDIIAGYKSKKIVSIGYNSTFLYPETGGIGSLSQIMAKRLQPDVLKMGKTINLIDYKKKTVVMESGETVGYDRLVTTSSLKSTLAMLKNPGDLIKLAGDRLRGRAVEFLDLGIKNVNIPDFHWCYVPEQQYDVYRVGIYSNAVSFHAKKSCSSLYVELSGLKLFKNTKNALKASVPLLKKMGIINSEDDILYANLRVIPDGYAVPDVNYEISVERAISFLKKFSIFPLGRFGEWKYSSMGEDMEAAIKFAKSFV